MANFQGNQDIPKLMDSIGIELDTYNKHLELFCRDVVAGNIRGATYSDCVGIHASHGSCNLKYYYSGLTRN